MGRVTGVHFDGDAIRADFAATLNAASLESVQHRAKRMAWVEGVDLHVVNVGSLNEIDPEKVISDWRSQIESYSAPNPPQNDRCVMGSVVSLFDRIRIHTWVWDTLGQNVIRDDVTTIETRRSQLTHHPI